MPWASGLFLAQHPSWWVLSWELISPQLQIQWERTPALVLNASTHQSLGPREWEPLIAQTGSHALAYVRDETLHKLHQQRKNKWIQWENQELFLERVEYILGRWRTPTREAELDWPPGNCSDLSPLATQQGWEKVILSQDGVILFLLISMEEEEKRGTNLTELTLRDLLRIGMKLFYLKKERWEGIPCSPVVLQASIAGGMGSIPGQRTKIAHATCHGKKRERAPILSLA